MTSVSAILALVSLSSEKEFLTQCAHDGLVELPLDKFVTVHFVDIALPLPDGALSTQSLVWFPTTTGGILD